MRSHLHPCSDVAEYVFFDPAAVPELIRPGQAFPTGVNWLTEYAQRGELLDYRDDGDGDLHTLVLVNEALEPRWLEIATQTLNSAILHAPSGRLFGIGAECLPADHEQFGEPDSHRPGRGGPESVASFPPGGYLVNAFELDPEQREERIAEELGPETMAVLSRVDNLTVFGCLFTAVVAAAALLAGIAALSNWSFSPVVMIPIGVGVAFLAVYWNVVLRLAREPEYREARDRQESRHREWPALILNLRTMTETEIPTEPTPGILRPAYYI